MSPSVLLHEGMQPLVDVTADHEDRDLGAVTGDVEKAVGRYKKGTAKSGRGGKGGKVKSRKQAIAIGLSKARKKGKKGPKKAASKKKASKKTSKKRASKTKS